MLKCLEFGAQGTTNAPHLYFTLFIEFSISGFGTPTPSCLWGGYHTEEQKNQTSKICSSFNLIFSFHFRCKQNIIIPLKHHWQVLNWYIKQEQGSIDLHKLGLNGFGFENR